MQTSPHDCHAFDRSLTTPEQYKSRFMRGLIHLCDCTEEVAESCADFSGLADRVFRNIISSGEKSDLAMMLSSAVGRIIAAQLNLLGVAIHKVAGASLYALSSLLSLAALGLARTPLGALRSPQQLAKIVAENKGQPIRLYEPVAHALLKSKERVLDLTLNKLKKCAPLNSTSCIKKWIRHVHRGHTLVPAHRMDLRKSHCSTIWKNLHQYGPVTRGLMHFAYFNFQVINKVLVSYDKHLGTAIGERLLARKTGSLLGCRLGLTLGVGLAAGLSVPLSPLLVGISSLGAGVCAVALIAMLLAKGNVYFFNDWKGNLLPKNKPQVLGSVTPTWP